MSVKRSYPEGNRAQQPAQAAGASGETTAILPPLESPPPQLRAPLAEAISAVVHLGGTQEQPEKAPLAEAISAVVHLAEAPPAELKDSLAEAISAVANIARASAADAKAPLAEAVAAIVHLAEAPPESTAAPASAPASAPESAVTDTPAAPEPSKSKLNGDRLLDRVSKIATAIAALSLVLGVIQISEQQKKQAQYQAWQVINSAQGKQGSGGRIEALQNLNKEGVSLAGVNLDKAHLAGIDLTNASLLGASLQSANLQGANLEGANLQGADIAGANFRTARNLTAEQIKRAKNWQKANYDSKLGTELGLLPKRAELTPRSQQPPKQRKHK